MQNMVLASPVLSDQAVISTSESPSGLPGSNLQNRSIKQVWRSLDPTNAFIVVQMPAGSFNLVAVLGHNGSSRCSARVRAANSEAALTSAPLYDSGLLPARSHQSGYDAGWAAGVSDEQYGALETNHFLLWLDNPVSYQWWRIDFNDPNTSYFDAGRLYISEGFQPGFNMSYGLPQGIVDPSRGAYTAGGRFVGKENPKRRYVELTLDFLTAQEVWDDVFPIEWERGTTRDVLIIPDPEEGAFQQKRTIYGRIVSLSPSVNEYFQIFQKVIRIEEIAG